MTRHKQNENVSKSQKPNGFREEGYYIKDNEIYCSCGGLLHSFCRFETGERICDSCNKIILLPIWLTVPDYIDEHRIPTPDEKKRKSKDTYFEDWEKTIKKVVK